MNKRHVQSFLMVSAAFFAMNLPVRAAGAATPDRLAAAVSHSVRMSSAGAGSEIFRTNDNEGLWAQTPLRSTAVDLTRGRRG